jgi:hypothetical protein
MTSDRMRVSEARANLSKILNAGKTVAIGQKYGRLHGFIVGVPNHSSYSQDEKRAALKKAKAAFTAAWIAEYQS